MLDVEIEVCDSVLLGREKFVLVVPFQMADEVDEANGAEEVGRVWL
jgi:hypothetical protein